MNHLCSRIIKGVTMKLLSPNYVLPQQIKVVNTTAGSAYSNSQVPTFKGGKETIMAELSKSIAGSLDSVDIKVILDNPKLKRDFFATLGTTIVSVAAALTKLLNNDDKSAVSDKKIINDRTGVKPSKTVTGNTTEPAKSVIKFNVTRGKSPQIEKDIIDYSTEKLSNNPILLDKVKLLFNKYCGSNRNSSHIQNNEVVANKILIQEIFNKIQANINSPEELNETITYYLALQSVDTHNLSNNIVQKPEAETASEVEPKIDEKAVKEQQERAVKEKVKNLEQLFMEENYDLSDSSKKSISLNLRKRYYKNLDKVEEIYKHFLNKEDKQHFLIEISNKRISDEALEKFDINRGINFFDYNNLKLAGANDDDIRSIAPTFVHQFASNLIVINDKNDFDLKVRTGTINQSFKVVKDVFETVNSQEITLMSKDVEGKVLDKDDIIEELRRDYYRHNGRTTYRNLISFLYGSKHNIYSEKDFDKNQYENRFDELISVINDSKIFNTNLFSNHCKFRFIERFVLSEDSGYKKLSTATRNTVRAFIEALRKEFHAGISVNSYHADDNKEKVGAQIKFSGEELANVKITLNNRGQIHTIM